MELIGAFAAALAMGSLILALAPREGRSRASPGSERPWRRCPPPGAIARRAREGAPRPGAADVPGASGCCTARSRRAGSGSVGAAGGSRSDHRPSRAALVRPLPRRSRGPRRGRRRAAGPAGDGQPGRRRRHVSGPVRGRGRGRPPSLGEGRLRGDPRALLRERAAGRRARRDPPPPGGAEPRSRVRRAHRPDPHPPAGVGGRRGAGRARRGGALEPVDRPGAAAESRGPAAPGGILAIVIPACSCTCSLANGELIAPGLDTCSAATCCCRRPRCSRSRASVLARDAAGGVGRWLRSWRTRDLGRRLQPAHGGLPPGDAVPRRLDAIRAAALPRHRYERLVSAEQPLWERLLAPVAGRLARGAGVRVPGERGDIIRAGFDPDGVARPRCMRPSSCSPPGSSLPAFALSPLSRRRLPARPSRRLRRLRVPDRVPRRPARSAARPRSPASCRTSSRSSGRSPRSTASSTRWPTSPTRSMRRRRAATCSRARSASAVAAYGTGTDLYRRAARHRRRLGHRGARRARRLARAVAAAGQGDRRDPRRARALASRRRAQPARWVPPRPSSPSSRRSSPASTCPSSSCSSWCPCSSRPSVVSSPCGGVP